MADLDLMKTPELLAYIKKLQEENQELRKLADMWPHALEKIEGLKGTVAELTRFADLGPYYLLGQGGFVTGDPQSRYCSNPRHALAFSSWLDADSFGRTYAMRWWTIFKVAYWDTESGLLGRGELDGPIWREEE